MTKQSPLGKYGLTGSTGLFAFPGTFHINAPYDACGKVFVEWKYRRMGEICEWWKRMTPARAKKEGRKIITCSVRGCGRAAVSLDHLWPYFNEGTLCKRHWERRK